MAVIRYLERPRFSAPINGSPGLYMEVLIDSWTPAAEIKKFIADDARVAGYDPEGRADLGGPCGYGIGTQSRAVWLYDRTR